MLPGSFLSSILVRNSVWPVLALDMQLRATVLVLLGWIRASVPGLNSPSFFWVKTVIARMRVEFC